MSQLENGRRMVGGEILIEKLSPLKHTEPILALLSDTFFQEERLREAIGSSSLAWVELELYLVWIEGVGKEERELSSGRLLQRAWFADASFLALNPADPKEVLGCMLNSGLFHYSTLECADKSLLTPHEQELCTFLAQVLQGESAPLPVKGCQPVVLQIGRWSYDAHMW